MRRLTGRHAAGATCCAPDGYSPSSCNDRFGGLDMHGWKYLHWLATARVNSHSGNWARATVSARLGRSATTVGGTVVAGK